MKVSTAAESSEIWGDLYSVKQAIYDSPEIVTRRFYFQTLKGTNFARPSFLVKMITGRNRSKNIATRWLDMDVMVQYYSTTEWDAVEVGGRLLGIFSGFPQVLLPKYDFSKSPPAKISISGINEYGEVVPRTMGIRIDPDSVKVTTLMTPDENWQANVEFNMLSPRRAPMDLAPFLTAATFQTINYDLSLPTQVSMYAHADLSASVV